MRVPLGSRLVCLVLSLGVLRVGGEPGGTLELPVVEDDPVIGSEKGAIHVITTTECKQNYFIFQSLALKYTLDREMQHANVTRIISCDDPAQISEDEMQIMHSLVVPNWAKNPRNDDTYTPYNRPIAIMYWFAQHKPTAEWTLILDPDMQVRQEIKVENFDLPPGYAASSTYSYLAGASNALADRHIPKVNRRTDTYGGPTGRRADYSGAFFLIRTRDLLKVAPFWLIYTEAVRDDPNSWNLTGDSYVEPGGKSWISEMYGYIYATASQDVWHKIDSTIQYYPGYEPRDIPIIMHYGLKMTINDYVFDKHYHWGFQSTECPPWTMDPGRPKSEDKGLFPHPPLPHTIKEENPRRRYGKLMIIEAVNTINQALCQRHRAKCAPSEQLDRECQTVDIIAGELNSEYEFLQQPQKLCYDETEDCEQRAEDGGCKKDWSFMDAYCRATCNRCRLHEPRSSKFPVLDDQPGKDQEPEKKSEEEAETKRDRVESEEKEEDDLHQEEWAPEDIDVEIIRCRHLSIAMIQNDTGCDKLVSNGYAKLEDLIASDRKSGSAFDRRETSEQTMWFLFVVIGLGAMLLIGYSRRTILRRRHSVKRM